MQNFEEKGCLTPTEPKSKEVEADQGETGKARRKKIADLGRARGTHQTREPKPSYMQARGGGPRAGEVCG